MRDFFYMMVGMAIPVFAAGIAYAVKVIWIAFEDLDKDRK